MVLCFATLAANNLGQECEQLLGFPHSSIQTGQFIISLGGLQLPLRLKCPGNIANTTHGPNPHKHTANRGNSAKSYNKVAEANSKAK